MIWNVSPYMILLIVMSHLMFRYCCITSTSRGSTVPSQPSEWGCGAEHHNNHHVLHWWHILWRLSGHIRTRFHWTAALGNNRAAAGFETKNKKSWFRCFSLLESEELNVYLDLIRTWDTWNEPRGDVDTCCFLIIGVRTKCWLMESLTAFFFF